VEEVMAVRGKRRVGEKDEKKGKEKRRKKMWGREEIGTREG
jgi:hypothetical protein